MNKIIILIPVYNDWESLHSLLQKINENIKGIDDFIFDCIVVNDASTLNPSKLIKPSKINSIKILNMKEYGMSLLYQLIIQKMHLE